jgi:uncharacterized SAM-binding protein YcdF (DUF218 family)
MMFLIKKAVSRLFFPIPFIVELTIIGWVLWKFSKFKRTGQCLMAFAFASLILLSYPSVPDYMLSSLENKYSPLMQERLKSIPQKTDIVVLGMGFDRESNRLETTWVCSSFMQRILEGARLQRQIPGSRIILSIGGIHDPAQEDRFTAKLAEVLALDPARIVLLRGARDTGDEIRMAKGLTRSNPVVLVTSASHLPRAMLIAKKQGLAAIPSPADFIVSDPSNKANRDPSSYFPATGNLAKSERAIYEYLGLAWENLF